MKQNKTKSYTFFSLFTGGGGLDIGFKEVGFKSLGASDIMPESAETYSLNWPSEPFILKDIRELTSTDILNATNGEKPDLIIGGPPCQGFSVMGDKNSSDPRNKLFEAYVRLVRDLSPQAFVFENVKGLKSMFGGRYLKMVANSFAEIGYDIYFDVLNSADYGVPQKRERVLIFGTKMGTPFSYPTKQKKSIGKIKMFNNAGEAIMDLVNKGKEIANHIALNHSDTVISRYKLIPEGGKLPSPDKLPKEIRRKNFGNTYTRLHRKELSPTMVPGNNAFPVHPTLNRSLTPREAARIQTFPDKVIFAGSRREQCILVGNAVPCLMAAHIARAVKNHLNGKVEKGNSKLLLKRNQSLNTSIDDSSAKSVTNNKQLTFIDLFSGAGGITIGLQNAGMKPLLAADFDKSVANTHRKNFPDVPFVEGDLSDIAVKEELLNIVDGNEVDIIVGGPPCQGFSIFGNRRFINTQTRDYDPHQDPRNKLVYTFLDYVKNIRPKWFIMENVPGFASLDNGSFVKNLIQELDDMGYKDHDFRIINTAEYGVPQQRKRFILIGNRTGHIIPWPKPKFFAEPEDWQKPYRTVGEVITDLAQKGSNKKFLNHKPMNHSELLKERFSYIEEGKKLDIDSLPKHLRIGTHTGKPIKNYSHVYKRLDRNKPSGTLVPGHSAFPIHPWLNRTLTVREAARIQTFPDWLDFQGSHTEQCRQVGNAFPALAAESLGNMLLKAILNNWTHKSLSKLAKYSLIDTRTSSIRERMLI